MAREFSLPLWTFPGRLIVKPVDDGVWNRLGVALPTLYTQSSARGAILREFGVSETGIRGMPKVDRAGWWAMARSHCCQYTVSMPNLQDLANLFSVFGLQARLGGPALEQADGPPHEAWNTSTTVDLGPLSTREVRLVRLNVTNPNPRDVALVRVSSSLPSVVARVEFLFSPSGDILIVEPELPSSVVWIRPVRVCARGGGEGGIDSTTLFVAVPFGLFYRDHSGRGGAARANGYAHH